MIAPRGKLEVWRFEDPVYDVRIAVLRGPWKKAFAWMDREFDGVTEDQVGGESKAKCVHASYGGSDHIVLWFHDYLRRGSVNHRVIAHETFHAAMRILPARNVQPSQDGGEEAYAYWIGWLFEETRRRLDA